MTVNLMNSLSEITQLAGFFADAMEGEKRRADKLEAALADKSEELMESRSVRSQLESARLQLMDLAFPPDKNRPTNVSLQDCIGQIRRAVDQGRRDARAAESYAKQISVADINLATAKKALHDARDMFLAGADASLAPSTFKHNAEKITLALIEIEKPG